MKSFLLSVSLVAFCLFAACGPTLNSVGGGDPNPAPAAMTPQAIMTAKPCSYTPWVQSPNISGQGWQGKPPTGMVGETCGGTTWGPFYCVDPTACPSPLTFQVSPIKPMLGSQLHFVVDFIGKIGVCAENAQRFGVGNLNCAPVTYESAAGMPMRVAVQVHQVGQPQEDGPQHVVIYSQGPKATILKIGTAEVTN